MGSPYWTLPIRPATSNRPEPRHPEGPVDAGRGDQEPAELWDPHHPVQAGGALGGRQRPQPDARPRQQDHLHLPHEVQLLPSRCSGVCNFHVTIDLSLFYDGKHSIWYFSQSVCSLSLHHRHLSKSSKVQNTLLSVSKNIFKNIVCNIYVTTYFYLQPFPVPRSSIRCDQVLTMLIPSSK